MAMHPPLTPCRKRSWRIREESSQYHVTFDLSVESLRGEFQHTNKAEKEIQESAAAAVVAKIGRPTDFQANGNGNQDDMKDFHHILVEDVGQFGSANSKPSSSSGPLVNNYYNKIETKRHLLQQTRNSNNKKSTTLPF